MQDYSKMSDFELNKAVAEVTYKDLPGLVVVRDVETRDRVTVFKDLGEETVSVCCVDYCNSWTDAGPIILKNRISVIFDESDTETPGEKFEWCGAISDCHKHQVPYLSNPLRAAMIVFLMMRESK